MTPKPVDLTKIKVECGGTFPTERLVRIIDGRETMRAHGDSNMPVWGVDLSHNGDVDDETVDAWIRSIVDYLETIQEE